MDAAATWLARLHSRNAFVGSLNIDIQSAQLSLDEETSRECLGMPMAQAMAYHAPDED